MRVRARARVIGLGRSARRAEGVVIVAVGDSNDGEAYGIVGDGEEQEELDARVSEREDLRGEQVRSGD